MDLPQPQPIYQQISGVLLREIMAGRLVDGAKLPTERALAAQFNTSVGTLRKALDALTEQGVLERVQGSGNYVKAPEDIAGIYAFFRLERAQGGGVPSAEIVSIEQRAVPQGILLETSAKAHRIRRRRFLDDMPVALEEIWLDGSCADAIRQEDVSDSLYQFYKLRLGLWISRAEDRVGLDYWPDWAEQTGTCGFVERQGWAQDGRKVEASRTWFDAAKARYVNRMQ